MSMALPAGLRPFARVASFCLSVVVAIASVVGPAAAADAAADPFEGRWWGEIGPERDRIQAGLEFYRRDDGKLGVKLTQPILNVFGADLGDSVVRSGDSVTVAPLALELRLQDGELVGHFPGAKSPARLHRIDTLPQDVEPPAVPTGPGPRWTVKLGGQAWATPAFADGVAYAGSTGGVVTAVTAATGEIAWTNAVGHPVYGEAALDRDGVYVVSDGGFVHKLARADGKELWRYDLGDGDVGRVLGHPQVYRWEWQAPRPLLADGVVYVGAADGGFHAIDAASGRRVWRADGDAAIRTGAALAGDVVVFGDHAGDVRALARADGATRWTFATGEPVDAIPLVHDGLVIVGNRGYGLYALALADGVEKWKTYFWGSWVESAAVAVDGVLYIGSSDLRRVSAIDPADGRPLWRSDVFGWTWGTPLVDGERIYAGAAGGSPYSIVHRGSFNVLSRRDGRLLARWPLPETTGYQWGIAGSPVAAGDLVLVTTIDGALLAFPRMTSGRPDR